MDDTVTSNGDAPPGPEEAEADAPVDGAGGDDLEVAGPGLDRPDPAEIRDPPRQPLLSWWRAGMVALLAVAALFVWGAVRAGGGSDGGIDTESAIVAYTPTPGGRVLRQSQVGVELEPGHDGRLTIDGVPIPEEQMLYAIEPGSPEYLALPEELRDQGPRPNNKHVVMFQPGPGQAITEYDTGTVEVEVRFWRIDEGPETARTVTYTIRVF